MASPSQRRSSAPWSLGPRDRLSQAFVKEQEKGLALEGSYGHYVNLDIRQIGEKVINKKLPFVRELCLKYANLDPVKELIPVRPVVHYMMGGVHTDIMGATSLAGLYAAGEVACVNLNGANRLGSNSLTECLVFGARAWKGSRELRGAGAADKRVAEGSNAGRRTAFGLRLLQQNWWHGEDR